MRDEDISGDSDCTSPSYPSQHPSCRRVGSSERNLLTSSFISILSSFHLPLSPTAYYIYISIILRVAEGSSVSIAYGNAEPEAMVTRQELDDVVALLSMTRNEATRRDTAMKAMQSTLDALAGSE